MLAGVFAVRLSCDCTRSALFFASILALGFLCRMLSLDRRPTWLLCVGLVLLVTSHYAMEDLIPMGLLQHEREVYQELIGVVQKRQEEERGPRPVVVITDVGKDYDDLAALVVLTEFHRLGLVELRAVVANLMPAEKRARLAKAALESLGLGDVPVGCGTPGSLQNHEVLDHEFKDAEFSRGDSAALKDGQELLLEVYQNAKERKEKLYLLCLSSLQDINEFAFTHSDLVAEHTAEVHMQGGNYFLTEDEYLKLEPDSEAANNQFNWDAAKKWHSFIQTNTITSHTYTKIAAFATPLTPDVFEKLQHPIGAYLRRVQVEQDIAFYNRACESDPKKRFAPFMDQEWFLVNKTNWYQQPHVDGESRPTGKEVIPYLTKIVLYDVYPALGVAGEDVVSKLGLFQSRDRYPEKLKSQGSGVEVHHLITGDESYTASCKAISPTVSSLLKGSLLTPREAY